MNKHVEESETLALICLPCRFTLVVNTADSVLTNISSMSPEFVVANLDPSQEYTAVAYSFNAKGWSKPSEPITLRTLPAASLREQRRITETGSGESKGHGPWLYILLAAGSTLIVAAAIGAIVFAVRKFRVESPVRERRQRSPKREEAPLNDRPPPYTDSGADDKNPDLIPPTNGKRFLMAECDPFLERLGFLTWQNWCEGREGGKFGRNRAKKDPLTTDISQ